MDAISNRYHLLLTTIESSTILALKKLFNQQVHPSVAVKKIKLAQLQASFLGSQLAIAQLEDALPDEPPAHSYIPVQPATIAANITLGMLGVVARTAIIVAFRQSAIAVYSANQIDGWIWEADADPCPFCLSMDGTIHPLSEEFESHNNCRCGTKPHIIS